MYAPVDPTYFLDLAVRQMAASRALTVCSDLPSLAAALASHWLSDDDSFISIQLEASAQPLVCASRTGVLPEVPAFNMVAALNDIPNGGQPLVVSDVFVSTIPAPSFRAWLEARGIRSFAAFPLRSDGAILGWLVWNNRRTVWMLPETALGMMQVLVDVAAARVQVERLQVAAQAGSAQLEAQVSTLEQINRLSAFISAAPDEETLLDRSAESIVALIGVDHCGIVIFTAGDASAVVAAEYPAHGSRGARLDVHNNPLWDELRRTGEPLLVQRVSNDPRIEPSTRKALAGLGVYALAILPLVYQGQMVGGVGLDIYAPDRMLRPEMIEIGSTVVTQINLALQNIRLLAAARRRADQTQRIAAFSQAVQTTLDLETILTIVLNESLQLLPMNQMSISLYDPLRQELRAVAQHTDGVNRVSLRDGDGIPLAGYVARVWETWEPLYIPDLRAVSSEMDPGVTLRSWMMTPILSRGRILGIASAGSSQPATYSETDIALFNQMVNQLALAVENAEAYRQTQRLAKNEALINDISSQLQRQMDLDSMLNITVSELGRALGARHARIRLGTVGTTPASDGGAGTE